MSERLSYDLNHEMIKILEAKFKADEVAQNFKNGLNEEIDVLSYGEKFFSALGSKWAESTLLLGEKYSDQTYENLKEIVREVKRFYFPHVPQRFIEIGYLATQQFESLDVRQNNHYAFIFRIPECTFFNSIKELCGPATAGLMLCQHACLNFSATVYKNLGLDVKLKMTASLHKDSFCMFEAINVIAEAR